MKRIGMMMLAVMVLAGASAYAAGIDGAYQFVSRTKDGASEMSGWTGQMVIGKTMMTRTYRSPDGQAQKFYEGTMKQEGDIYTVKFTKAYKPEYVGNEHRNKIVVNGQRLVIESEDGQFKETWVRR